MSQDCVNLGRIADFIGSSSGLRASQLSDRLRVTQINDGKFLELVENEIDEVIPRMDADGQPFLQVNFFSEKKILLTDAFIGFKPLITKGLDMNRLPKVVTTPDLISVVEAIEDALSAGQVQLDELDVLKKVFESVMRGAESVGFDLTSERMWLQRMTRSAVKASA